MGIISRFKDIMSANINALLDKCEDPEKMIDQYMRNLQSDLGKVKAETASVMADEQRAKRELDECTAEINSFRLTQRRQLQQVMTMMQDSFLPRSRHLLPSSRHSSRHIHLQLIMLRK